jgi:hypothetical protein
VPFSDPIIHRIRRAVLLAAATVATAPLAACSGGGDARRPADPTRALLDVPHAFHRALADGRAKDACALLTPAGRYDFTTLLPTCEAQAAFARNAIDAAGWKRILALPVRDVEIHRDTAVLSPDGSAVPQDLADRARLDLDATELVRRNGRWLIDGLG